MLMSRLRLTPMRAAEQLFCLSFLVSYRSQHTHLSPFSWTMSTSASNPYANTLRALFAGQQNRLTTPSDDRPPDTIVFSAKITPPASYKSRVTAQLVLGVILCFTLSLFLILSIRNRLRAGRKFRLLYLQQVSEGRIVVIDTLAFSGIFAWLGTIGLTVSLVYRYRKYVLGQEIPWQVGVLLFVVMYEASSSDECNPS